jgi:hypothetical protein
VRERSAAKAGSARPLLASKPQAKKKRRFFFISKFGFSLQYSWIWTVAMSAMSEAYAKVMGDVEKVQPQRVEEFQGWCQYYGSAPNEEAEVKGKEFYEYLTAAFGPAFAAGLVPDLAHLIPDEVKKTVLLKCAGIDYVSPITATALFAKPPEEDVKLTPEEEAALKEREEAKAKAEADQLAALQHESVEGLAGSELAAAECRNAEKDCTLRLQQGKTSMWDMTKMGENHTF